MIQIGSKSGIFLRIAPLATVSIYRVVTVFIEGGSGLDSPVYENEAHGAEVIRKNLDPYMRLVNAGRLWMAQW